MPELSLFVDDAEKNADWDQFVRSAKHGHFIQSSSWAVVKRTQGWKALRFILKSEDGSIYAGAQVLYKQYFGFMNLILLVYGPVCAEGYQDCALKVLDEIKHFFHNRLFFLYIQPFEKDWDLSEQLNTSGYLLSNQGDLEPAASLIIDVSRSEEEIILQLKKGKRPRLRSAQNRGVICYESTSKADLDTFYALHQNLSRKNDFVVQNRAFFDELWDQFVPLGQLHLFMAKIEDTVVASYIITTNKDVVSVYRIGWMEGHSHYYPNEGIYWYAIQWAKQHGFHWFDFHGIDIGAAKAILEGRELDEEFAHSYSAFKIHICDKVVLMPRTVQFIHPAWFYAIYKGILHSEMLMSILSRLYGLIRKR
jgi:peptidoglycan pentaglycine glycine transferase (the first glycine)